MIKQSCVDTFNLKYIYNTILEVDPKDAKSTMSLVTI